MKEKNKMKIFLTVISVLTFIVILEINNRQKSSNDRPQLIGEGSKFFIVKTTD